MKQLPIIDAKDCKITWHPSNRLYLSYDPTTLYESETRTQFTVKDGKHKGSIVVIVKNKDNNDGDRIKST